jgi:hypothetical protein
MRSSQELGPDTGGKGAASAPIPSPDTFEHDAQSTNADSTRFVSVGSSASASRLVPPARSRQTQATPPDLLSGTQRSILDDAYLTSGAAMSAVGSILHGSDRAATRTAVHDGWSSLSPEGPDSQTNEPSQPSSQLRADTSCGGPHSISAHSDDIGASRRASTVAIAEVESANRSSGSQFRRPSVDAMDAPVGAILGAGSSNDEPSSNAAGSRRGSRQGGGALPRSTPLQQQLPSRHQQQQQPPAQQQPQQAQQQQAATARPVPSTSPAAEQAQPLTSSSGAAAASAVSSTAAPVTQVVPLSFIVGTLLRDVVARHATINKFNQALPASRVIPALTTFESSFAPPLDIADYLHRLQHYLRSEDAICAAVVVLLRKYVVATGRPLTIFNVHRLLATALLITAKLYSDHFFCNQAVAVVAGLPNAELNRLELAFLHVVDFNASVAREDVDYVLGAAQRRAALMCAPTGDAALARRPCATSESGIDALFPDSLIVQDLLRDEEDEHA